MKIDAITMKEKSLLSVWEKLRELARMLEESFPDLAEEVDWLSEAVRREREAVCSERNERTICCEA